MKIVYIDTEYRDNQDLDSLVLFQYQTKEEDGTRYADYIDFRTSNSTRQEELFSLVETYKDAVWLCFNGGADLGFMLTAGVDVSKLKFIDLMVESAMIMLSHPKYFNFSFSLLNTLRAFKIDTDKPLYDDVQTEFEFKTAMRDLILDNELYTDEQWNKIVKYGMSDIADLHKVFSRIIGIHNGSRTGNTLETMYERGEYVKACTDLYHHTKGFPVNGKRLKIVLEAAPEIKNEMAEKCNENFNAELYEWDKKVNRYILKYNNFEAFINNQLKLSNWMATDTGKLSMDSNYIKERSLTESALRFLYDTIRTIHALSDKQLQGLQNSYKNGYIKPRPFPFAQRTSRNSPKPTEGFILNMTGWIRNALIHPHDDEVFIGIDWSQQEMFVAASLSNDPKLKEVYMAEDSYMELAKLANAVPPDATKKTHPVERQMYKQIQLGLNYGMGIRKLTERVYESHIDYKTREPTISLSQAEHIAKEIVYWHKNTFYIYWNWLEEIKLKMALQQHMNSIDNWVFWNSPKTSRNVIMNFPMQSGGAAILRESVKQVHKDGCLDMVCSLHDALYIMSDKQHYLDDITRLQACMETGGRIIPSDIELKQDAPGIYTKDKPFWDERGATTYKVINDFIGSEFNHQ